MVSALDDAVGRVTDTLLAKGMLENSIIVFTTDNGGPANGFDFNAASNWPLRYLYMYAELLCVCFVPFLYPQITLKLRVVYKHVLLHSDCYLHAVSQKETDSDCTSSSVAHTGFLTGFFARKAATSFYRAVLAFLTHNAGCFCILK